MSPREGIAVGALIVTLLAILLVGASSQLSDTREYCTAEARIQPDGSTVGRSPAHDCQFVDADGNILGN